MEENIGRRNFLKYLFSSFIFAVTSILSFRFNKDEGFKIGKRIDSLGPPEASGMCGAGLNCAGGGGMCGAGLNCAGGGGMCGAGLNCAGR